MVNACVVQCVPQAQGWGASSWWASARYAEAVPTPAVRGRTAPVPPTMAPNLKYEFATGACMPQILAQVLWRSVGDSLLREGCHGHSACHTRVERDDRRIAKEVARRAVVGELARHLANMFATSCVCATNYPRLAARKVECRVAAVCIFGFTMKVHRKQLR